MALMPKRVLHRKAHRGRIRGNATRGNTVAHGDFALQSLEAGRINNRQIEAGRMAATHYLHREGRVYIRIFPHKSITKKPAETRMGKGKGDIVCWVAPVRRGAILFELGGIPEALARQALRLAAFKLPMRTKFVSRVVYI